MGLIGKKFNRLLSVILLVSILLSLCITPLASAEPDNGDINISETEEIIDPENNDDPVDDPPEEPGEPIDEDKTETDPDAGEPDPDVDEPENEDEDDEEEVEELDYILLPGEGEASILKDADGAEYLDGQVLISFEASVTSGFNRMRSTENQILTTMSNELSSLPGMLDSVMSVGDGAEILAIIDLPDDISVEEAIATYEKDSLIEYAQPVYIYRQQIVQTPHVTDISAYETDFFSALEDSDYGSSPFDVNEPFFQTTSTAWRPNDPLVGAAGAINPATHHDHVKAFEAWELLHGLTDRNKVRVAVIDSQIDLAHPDLTGRLLTNLSRYFRSGIKKNISATDPHYHGTHVAGLIAATSDNGIGSAGVAAGRNNEIVDIIPINVFEWIYFEQKIGNIIYYWYSFRAYNSSTIKALDYARKNKANVINMSLGSPSTGDKAFRNAIDRAIKAGVTVVAAAGNEGDDRATFPSDHPNVISVINICHTTNGLDWATTDDEYGTGPIWPPTGWVNWQTGINPRSISSSYGTGKNISGPGSFVWGPVPPGQEYYRFSHPGYDIMNGTSMASPVVAGIAAMMLYANPRLTPTQVANVLYQTATDVHNVGIDYETGHGGVNAEAAVFRALLSQATPPAPTVTLVNSFNNRIEWRNTGADSYTVYRREGTGSAAAIATIPGGTFIHQDYDITPGTTYHYSVSATLQAEESDRGAERSVTVARAPQPGAISRTSGGPFNIRLSWSAATIRDFDTSYRVERRLTSGGAYLDLIERTTETNFIDETAIAGVSYIYRVTPYWEINSSEREGTPRESAAFVVPTQKAPSGFRAMSITPTEIMFIWTPITGVSGYEIHFAGETRDITHSNPEFIPTTAYFSGLNPDTTYFAMIRGYWTVGTNKEYSAYSSIISPRTPGPAPGNVRTTVDSPTSITVTWNPVPNTNPAHSYNVYIGNEAPVNILATEPLSHTFNDLNPATRYEFRVSALWNAGAGEGRLSNAVNATTTGPAPTNLRVSGPMTQTSAHLVWSPVLVGDGTENNVPGYLVNRNNGTEPVFVSNADFVATQNGWIDNTLRPGVEISYTIQACWGDSIDPRPGNASAAMKITPPGGVAPTGVTAVVVSPTSIDVTWNSIADADGYRVHVGSEYYDFLAHVTSPQIGGLNPLTRYQVRVAALWEVSTGDIREGRSSSVANVTTTGPAPTGLSVRNVTSTGATLEWNHIEDTSGYFVYNNGAYVGFAPAAPTDGKIVYNDTSLTPGTQTRFTVRACWQPVVDHMPGNASSAVTANPPGPAPTGLKLQPGLASTPTAINIQWNEVTGASSYNVYTGNTLVANTASTSTILTDLNPGTRYPVRVAAVWDVGGDSRQGRLSNAANLSTAVGPAPTSLRASNVTSFTTTLTWNPVSTLGVTHYRITKNDGSGSLFIGATDFEVDGRIVWEDPNVRPGVSVRYTVQACWGSGDRPGRAATVSASPRGGTAPAGVRAVVNSPSAVTVTWNAITGTNAAGLTGYKVYVGTEEPKIVPVSDPRSIQFTDLAPGTRYQVRVASMWFDSGSATIREGRSSRAINVTTIGPAPRNLRASNVTMFGARLTWNPVTIPGVVGYRITRGGIEQDIISTEQYLKNSNGWNDTTLSPGMSARYTVQAVWQVGAEQKPGAGSGVNVRTSGGAAPGRVSAVATGSTTVTVTWNALTGKNAAGLTGYRVYVGDEPPVDILLTAPRSATVTGLTPDTRYPVRVVGLWTPVSGPARDGRSSTTVNVTTLPAP